MMGVRHHSGGHVLKFLQALQIFRPANGSSDSSLIFKKKKTIDHEPIQKIMLAISEKLIKRKEYRKKTQFLIFLNFNLGICKLLLAIGLAELIFGASLNITNCIGIGITMMGVAAYNYRKFIEKQMKKTIPYQKQEDHIPVMLPEFELGDTIEATIVLEEDATAI